jgi:hypothetical protein
MPLGESPVSHVMAHVHWALDHRVEMCRARDAFDVERALTYASGGGARRIEVWGGS